MSLAKVVASVISQLSKGTPLHKITVPAFIHCPKSKIEIIAEYFLSEGSALCAWNRIATEKEYEMRIGSAMEAFLNVHTQFYSDKPFNSILGEICEFEAKVEGERYTIKTERISHHPPVTGVLLEGPNFKVSLLNGLTTGSLRLGIIFNLKNRIQQCYI